MEVFWLPGRGVEEIRCNLSFALNELESRVWIFQRRCSLSFRVSSSKLSSNVFQYKCFIRHFSPSTYFFNIYLRNPCNFSFFLNHFLFVVTIIVLYIWCDSSILRYTIFNHQKSVLSLKLFQSIRAFILLVLFHWKLKCYTHRSSQNV